MKVVRIIARLNVGGPARHVIWLTKALDDEEFRSVLLTGTVPEGEEDMSYFAAENSVDPVYIPEMSRELSPKDVVSLWKVFKRLRREKPDIIHTHTAKAGSVGRVAGFLYRWLLWKDVKIVHTFHGHVFHSYYGKLKTSVFLLIERVLARVATDRIVVISERQRAEICEDFGVGRAEQFAVIPLGIELTQFSAAESKRDLLRQEIGAADDEILVGFVGRLTEIKNIPMLLAAAAKVSPDKRLRFVIIGDGHLRSELEELTRELGIGSTVTFLGNRNDSGTFYAGLDLVALCSLNEGTPLTLIEAMANGKPFISTEVGGVGDLAGKLVGQFTDFAVCERGVTVKSGDVDGFVAGLEYLAGNIKLQIETGARGKRFVEENYSRERLVSDIRELYRELTAGERRTA
ncbi:MAG: glycosyltransferase [Acidobacteria bacterium]|nr:glycosyltransferase [Acidobacteriota bacterium]